MKLVTQQEGWIQSVLLVSWSTFKFFLHFESALLKIQVLIDLQLPVQNLLIKLLISPLTLAKASYRFFLQSGFVIESNRDYVFYKLLTTGYSSLSEFLAFWRWPNNMFPNKFLTFRCNFGATSSIAFDATISSSRGTYLLLYPLFSRSKSS